MPKDEIMKELKAIREELRVIRNRLSDDSEMSDEEKRLYDECMKDAAEGKTVPLEELRREISD